MLREIIGWLISSIFIIFIILFLIYLIPTITNEWKMDKAYNNFCKERPSYCYCSLDGCEFRTVQRQTCLNNNCSEYKLDENSKELCKLAKELDDKKMLFKVGCEE